MTTFRPQAGTLTTRDQIPERYTWDVTAICRDLETTIGFYRDVMGLGIVHDAPSDDDPDTRHVWFGALDGSALAVGETYGSST